MKRQLHGMTWAHTRGLLPMLATAQVFSERYPDTDIHWTVRSLQAFADAPLEKLAKHYDLLVIDHPFSGRASRGDTLLPLDEYLPEHFLKDQAENTVGQSHTSYQYGEHQWALAIDAATPVAGWQTGLFTDHSYFADDGKLVLPKSWDDVLQLARGGHVIFPGLAIDSLMHFYMFCVALGEEPLSSSDQLISYQVGIEAYMQLLGLVVLCDPDCLDRNPIATWQFIASSEQPLYCPFAYGYSNYARRGYAANRLSFGTTVAFGDQPLRTTLGGAGLAISTQCKDQELALRYAQFVASADCQTTLYCDAGGQPGHRKAWMDPTNNSMTLNYFADTLPVLDSAYVRPRFEGYLHVQDALAPALHACLKRHATAEEAMATLNTTLAQTRRQTEHA